MDGDNGDKLMLVGIGASAGGVEALMRLFERMPADTGMAFVVILHLSREHESRLAEVLGAKTRMPVEQVNESVRVEPNRVYVVPPDRDLYMADSQIRLAERGGNGKRPSPIDLFFRTLADSYKERAVVVVLSGAGTDGSVGVRRVKEEGGVCLAQDPEEAQHAQMPRAAVETGAVDFVLAVASMPEKLVGLRRNAERIQLPAAVDPPPDADEGALSEVLGLLRARTRHDFSGYKRSTLLRRVERRMQVTETEDLPAYLAHVREHPEELPRLLDDLLISVTNFFRDRDAFAQLEDEVVPLLFADKGAGNQVRVWVAGCATGEEAYSLAMLLCEQAERQADGPAFQVFASDIDEEALTRAREGVYPEGIEADVSPERLKRFFVRDGQYYRVNRELRERVLFTPHNVLRDPPFSKLDLVSCRNLLIYVNRSVQERVLEIFHFALRPGGHLFLGSSESAESLPDLFIPADKKHRLFRRVDAPNFRGAPALPVSGRWEPRLAPPPSPSAAGPGAGGEASSFSELHYRALETLAPPSVLVNADYDIVHVSEHAGRFLRVSGGEPSRNLLKVAHPELHLELRSLLLRAEQSDGASRDVPVHLDGGRKLVRVSVRPVATPRTAPGFRLVLFEELPEAAPQSPQDDGTKSEAAGEDGETLEPVVRQLEEELQRTREQLRATVEMYETQAEEFRASNEEFQATNEELRSATEELETGKEELQSVNEELSTVNAELKDRVEEVSRSNSDLQNLMASTRIATLFLDRSLFVKRYTPPVQEIFNLIPGDVGRPVAHLTHRLDYAGLVEDAESVLRTLHTVEREAGTRDGRHYLVRLMPYRTLEDRIEGVVVTFVDITERRRAEEALQVNEERARRQKEAFQAAVDGAPLEDSLNTLASIAAEETAGAARTAFYIADPGGERLHTIRGAGSMPESYADQIDGFLIGDDSLACGLAVPTGRPVVTPDVYEEPLWKPFLHIAEEFDYRGCWSFPIKTRESRAVGTFAMYFREPREATPQDISLAEIITQSAAVIISSHTEAQERARAEAALRESEAKFRAMFETMIEACCIFEMIYDDLGKPVDWRILEANAGYERQSGLEGVAGKLASEVMPGTEPYWIETFGRVVETGEAEQIEKWHQPTGRWIHSSTARVGGSGSRRLVSVFYDITERKRAEEALRESEEKYRALFNEMDEAYAVVEVMKGEDGRWNDFLFLDANPAFIEHTAMPYPVGKTATQLLGTPNPRWAQVYGEVSETGEPVRIEETEPLLGRVFDLNIFRLGGPGSRRVAVLFTNVTARKEAEAALRESQRRFQSIANLVPDLLWDSEPDGSTNWYNQRWLEYTGQSSEQAIGWGWADAIHPDDREGSARRYGEAVKAGEPLRQEHRIRRHDGEYRWFVVNASPLKDENGRVVKMYGAATDIHDQRVLLETISQSEERLRDVLDSMADGFALLGSDFTILDVNEETLRLDGRTRDELIGRSHWEAFPGTEDSPVGEIFRRVAREHAPASLEHEYRWSDEKSLWIDMRAYPTQDGGVAIFWRDITDRRRAEEALRESEEKYRTLFDSIDEGYLICEVIFDENDKPVDILYLDANPAAVRLAGRDFTGRRMREIDPDYEDYWYEIIGRVGLTGEAVRAEHYAEPHGHWFDFYAFKIGGQESRRVASVFQDTTERKQAEERLRASEERLRLVVESVEDYAIFTMDTTGRIDSWNSGAERTFGYTEGEAVGQHAEIVFTPEDRERGVPEEEMRQAREAGRAADERWHVSKRGARFYVSGVMAPLRDERGAVTGYAKIARDLTERKEMEEALRRAHDELEERVGERTRELQETAAELLVQVKERAQAEERVRALLKQMVTVQEEERRRIARELHDTLGQQLAALHWSIEHLKSKTGEVAGVREETERMRSIFDSLNADVDFLAWELRPAALDTLGLDAALQTFVREWSEHFKVAAAYRGPGDGAPRLAPEVETNLYRILQEALQNVHKHAGATHVSVILEQRDGRAVLVVEDNGRGYDPDAEVAADSNKGMGVTNMRERAALCGGELEIESRPGAGTTIFVRVPAGGPAGPREGA